MTLERAEFEAAAHPPCSEMAYRLAALGGVLLYYGQVAREMVRSRRLRPGVLERLGRFDPGVLRRLRDYPGPHVWMHAASLGECKAGMVIAGELRRQSDTWVTVSTSTATGKLAAAGADRPPEMCIYYPADLPGLVRRAVGRLRPDVYVIVEGDYFPHILGAMARRRAPVCVVNGRAPRPDGLLGHRRLRPYWSRMLQEVTAFGVTDPGQAERLLDLGVAPDRIRVLGNVKHCAVEPLASSEEKRELRRRAGIDPSDCLVVAGSTHHGEEAGILEAFGHMARGRRRSQLVIAPRRVERLSAVEHLVARSGFEWCVHKGRPTRPRSQVAIVSDYGHLVEWYRVADVAVVGGSFVPGFGGHNAVEPLAAGAGIAYGPYMRTTDVTSAMERQGCARRADCVEALASALTSLPGQPQEGALEYARQIAAAARAAARAYAGLICEMLERRTGDAGER